MSNMRLLVLSKYPPMSGGVSSHTQALTNGLAARGWDITIISHALCCGPEASFSRAFMSIAAPTSPRVTVHYVNPNDCPPQMPPSDKYVSRVASLALRELRANRHDLIYSHYMEPYGVAAYMASTITRVPWAHEHAGSDLTTLGGAASLSFIYDDLLRACPAVIARLDLRDHFAAKGIADNRLKPAPLFAPDPAVFSPDAKPFDLDELPDRAGAQFPESATPLIVMYGKPGPVKGQLQLIKACAAVTHPFHVLFITAPSSHAWILKHSREHGLAKRVTIASYLPNEWIPSLLRHAAIACQLEYGFPVAIHHSVAPFEIMLTNTCLLVGNGIFEKQLAPLGALDQQHVCVVNPSSIEHLAGNLENLLRDTATRTAMAQAGRRFAQEAAGYPLFLDCYENIFMGVAGLAHEA